MTLDLVSPWLADVNSPVGVNLESKQHCLNFVSVSGWIYFFAFLSRRENGALDNSFQIGRELGLLSSEVAQLKVEIGTIKSHLSACKCCSKTKDEIESMGSWNGYLVVLNSTNQTITDVSVIHSCGGITDQVQAASMAPNTSTKPIKLHGQSGCDDLWTIAFKLNDESIGRTGKQCNFEPEDANQTVYVALNASDFSIVYPKSDSCMNNHY